MILCFLYSDDFLKILRQVPRSESQPLNGNILVQI